MPKSVSTIQNQISGCERSMHECLTQCHTIVENTNFQFNFDLNNFVRDVMIVNLDEQASSIGKVQQLLVECEKIVMIEKKRRKYTEELHKILADRERRDTVKRLTVRNRFTTTTLVRIPSQPSQE